MLFFVYGSAIFISFSLIYHFIILRPYHPRFYQETSLEDNYIDIRNLEIKYYKKSKYTHFIIYSFYTLVSFFWLINFGFLRKYYLRGSHESWFIINYSHLDHTILYFLIAGLFVVLISLYIASSISMRKNNEVQNPIIMKNRWSQHSKKVIFLLMMLSIILITLFLKILSIINHNYRSNSFIISVLFMIFSPWVFAILIKLTIAIINYFINPKKNRLNFKTYLSFAFNKTNYTQKLNYIYEPTLIICSLPMIFILLIFDASKLINLMTILIN